MSTAIELDKTRQLHFPIAALKRIEQQSGVGILTGVQAPSITFISTCLFHGLYQDDPSLTQAQVDDILEAELREKKNIIRIWEIVVEEFKQTGIMGDMPVRKNVRKTEQP